MSKMRKPLKSREELVQDLGRIFRTHGFDGATLTLLTEGTGLERASLYHHFPKGKADMAEAVLLHALSDLKFQVIEKLIGEGSAEKRVGQMLTAVEKFYNDGNDVCFITIFSLTNVSKKVTQLMGEAIQMWARLLESALSELKVERPREAAQQALSSIQGSLIFSRAISDPKVFKNTLKHLRSQWLKQKPTA